MDVRFVVVSPASLKRSVAVRLPILVGRSDEARFRLRQDSVSRRHCEFFIEDDAVHVRDLGSTNGTFLDGKEIAAETAAVGTDAGSAPRTVVHHTITDRAASRHIPS